MKKYVRSAEYKHGKFDGEYDPMYESIIKEYPLVATFDDDLYGRCFSVYDLRKDFPEGNRYALLDDQNKYVVEIKENTYDDKWVDRYLSHIRDYRIKNGFLDINYNPDYLKE